MNRKIPIHEQASIGFERAAAAYERGRPDYPPSAVKRLVEALQIGPASRVVELGAGTGKFTRSLTTTGAQIVAVEPVEAMRHKLGERLPNITIIDGTAEAVPLPDASVDAVVAAQAFHWFRGPETLTEIHRVLKPGRGLGLIWNARDESASWLRGLTQIIEPFEGATPRYKSFRWKEAFESTSLFGPLEKAEFANVQRLPAEAMEDRVASISFIAALPDPTREAVLAQVRKLTATDPALRGRSHIAFPY